MLKIGDAAPSFELESDAGGKVRLEDFRGKFLVIYFYPKDDTPGCTREAQGFTALAKDFEAAGAKVVGVSRDTVASHCKFRDKYKLAIPLLSDRDSAMHKAYGAWGLKTNYGKTSEGVLRSTFVIDGAGTLVHSYPTVKVDGHAEAVLARVRELSAPAKPVAPTVSKQPEVEAESEEEAPKAAAKKKVAKKKVAAKRAVKKR